MQNNIIRYLIILMLAGVAVACSTPEEKAAEYVENGKALFEQGKLKKAELEYRNALQVNQNLADAWFGLAKIREQKQEWRQAYAALNKIRELAPNHVEARIMLGQILLASGELEQALKDSQEILEMAPDNPRSHALMAAVLFRLENFSGAHASVDKAFAIDANSIDALLVRVRLFIAEQSIDKALELLDQSIAANPDIATLYLMKIQAHQARQDAPAIEQVYLSLIKQFPDRPSFKQALVRHYLSQKKVDEAEVLLQQIVNAEPSNVEEKLRLVGFRNQFRSADEAIALVKNYINDNNSEFRYRFLLGELFENNNRRDEAREVYLGIINDDELNPNGIEARNKMALLEIRDGNYDKARTLIDEVLSQDKANENALLLQTGFQIAENQYDDAIVNARTVLRDNPESVKALGLLGQAYDANGSRQLAEESYIKAFQINPGNAAIANRLARQLIQRRKVQQADEVLTESISHGNRSLDAIKLLTRAKLVQGEWDQAEQLARQLENVEGQEALSQQVLGMVYRGKQRPEDSIDAFKKAYELSPTSPQPIVSVVQTYTRAGKVNEARRFLNSVLSVDPDNITAYLLLGQLSLNEKKVPEAIGYFNKAIEVNPRVDSSYRKLASIYIAQKELDKAEGIIQQGLQALPDLPSLTMSLASVYERQLNFDKAIALYEQMLEKNPNQIIAKNNLASLLTDYVGDQASVERARMISADLKDSQIPQFRDTYAWASVQSGINLEEAVIILEGVVKDNEQVDVFNYHLGEAYRKTGETDNAIAYLKKATELARPGSDIANKAKQSLQQIN